MINIQPHNSFLCPGRAYSRVVRALFGVNPGHPRAGPHNQSPSTTSFTSPNLYGTPSNIVTSLHVLSAQSETMKQDCQHTKQIENRWKNNNSTQFMIHKVRFNRFSDQRSTSRENWKLLMITMVTVYDLPACSLALNPGPHHHWINDHREEALLFPTVIDPMAMRAWVRG